MIEHGHDGPAEIVWPVISRHVTVEVYLPDAAGPKRCAGFAQIDSVDPVAHSLFLNRSALQASINAIIDRDSDDSAALDDATRAERLATIAADRLLIERDEIALIERASAEGLSIAFRPDTSPLALLQITVVYA